MLANSSNSIKNLNQNNIQPIQSLSSSTLTTHNNFSSLLQVKLDVQVIQNALSNVLSDINNRLNTLSAQTCKFQKETGQKLIVFDNSFCNNNQRLDYIQEIVNEQQKKINLHQKMFQALNINGNQFDQLGKKINWQGQSLFKNFQNSGKNNLVNNYINSNSNNQEGNQRQNLVNEDPNNKNQSNISSKKKNNKGNFQDKNSNINVGKKITSSLTPLVGIPELAQLQDKYQERIAQLQKNMNKQMDELKLGMQNLKIDTQQSSFSTKKLLLSKKRLSVQSNNNLINKLAHGISHQTNNQFHKQKTQQNLALDNIQDKLQDIRQQFQRRFNLLIQVDIENFRNQIINKIIQITDLQNAKIDQNSKDNVYISDFVLGTKGKIEDIKKKQNDDRTQINNINVKMDQLRNQIFLIKETTKISKESMDTLQSKFKKIEINSINNNQDGISNISQNYISQNEKINIDQPYQYQQQKKNFKRGSILSNRNSNGNASQIRNSVLTNLHNPNLININGQSLQDFVRKINQKIITLTDRVNRWQDQRKTSIKDNKSGFFPKIQGSKGSSNTPSFDIVKIEIKKLNDELIKTNERLESTKVKLSNLYDAHNLIPLQIQDLYKKLQQYNEFQEDRLLQLIKQLINRCLTDPFNNNFTNTLKREINVKFLQIKHQYYGILKQIQTKVEDRAQAKQLTKLKNKFEQNLLQIKTIVQKKCDNDDLKKGLKYLENRVKQVFTFVKAQSQINHQKNQNKCYVSLKKQF